MEALSGINRDGVIGTSEQWRAFYASVRPVMADLILDETPVSKWDIHYPGRYSRSNLIDGAYEAEDFFPDLGSDGKWLHFTASPIRGDTGEVIGAIETLEDITERKVAEKALNESERNFRALFEDACDAMWMHDLNGDIQTANKAAASLIGYSIEELQKMNVKSFLHDDSLCLAREISTQLLQDQRVNMPYEIRLIRKDGSEAICMVSTNLFLRGGKPKSFQNIARDVTHERRMQENLRYYLQEITRTQEDERKRIARELHDDTAQLLGSLARQLDNFTRQKHELAPGDTQFLQDMKEQLNAGVQNVHRFIQDLRPSLLDDLGFIPAVRSLVKVMQESTGIKTSFELCGNERRLPPETELLLFRIVQEALNNVMRHSQASETQITIVFVPDKVNVTISDNGRGFKLSERLYNLPRSSKLGIIGMQERTQLLGGSLEVKSTPSKGTTVTLEVPV
jgi:PAS domain S-box-containing protein